MLNLSNCLDNCPLICLPSAFNSKKEKRWFGNGLRSFTVKGLFTLPLATGGNPQPNPLLLELVSLEGAEQQGSLGSALMDGRNLNVKGLV